MSVSLIDGHIDDDVQMTDEQIIKAFRLCHRQNGVIPCLECPYHLEDTDECLGDNNADILDLINRQKAEIENKDAIILEQKELIERTQKLVENTDKNCRTAINIIGRYERQFKSIKAEAIKEFAERLKEDLRTGEPIRDNALRDVIDNLAKERVGEG